MMSGHTCIMMYSMAGWFQVIIIMRQRLVPCWRLGADGSEGGRSRLEMRVVQCRDSGGSESSIDTRYELSMFKPLSNLVQRFLLSW